MIPLHDLLIYVGVYAFVIALPGPNVIAIAARALGGGFRAAVPAALGTALGDIMLMSFSAFGLEFVASTSSRVFLAVKFLGVLYLLWLGYKYWTAPVEQLGAEAMAAPSTTCGGPPPPLRRGGKASFFAQLAVTAGNPKGMAFFFALLPAVIDLTRLNVFGYLELVAATLILIPAITLSYAALADRARIVLASETAQRRLNKSAGAIITAAALAIAVG
jgi:threonine/homoserine/homoserine lactone efflux protein